jgi:hypothetical protein
MASSSLLHIMEMVHNKLYNLTLSNHIHLFDKAVTVMYLKKVCFKQAVILTVNSLPGCLTYNMHSAHQVLSDEYCLTKYRLVVTHQHFREMCCVCFQGRIGDSSFL